MKIYTGGLFLPNVRCATFYLISSTETFPSLTKCALLFQCDKLLEKLGSSWVHFYTDDYLSELAYHMAIRVGCPKPQHYLSFCKYMWHVWYPSLDIKA